MSSPLDAVPAGVLTLSSDLRVLRANHALAALVGRPIEELVGRTVDAVLSAPSRILFQTHVYPALRSDGRVEEVFLTLSTATGDPVPVLMNAVRAVDADDEVFEAVVVRITARARWEAELLAATRALEQERASSQRLAEDLAAAAEDLRARHADEQRSRQFRDAFAGIVSHELRTPITTIFGMTHLLRRHHRSLDDETMEERLTDIESESDRLRRLTEDLLVLSRAEAGRLAVSTEPISVTHVVRAAVEGERTRSPDHAFELELQPGLPIVLGEELYVEQVVRNYLSNAVKYSPAGTTVRTDAAIDGDGLVVRVVDAGPGIGDQVPDQLFELFYRSPSAMRESGGAGIGLFVCRALIGAMGGRVWAAAAPTGGAEFGFWLPAADEGGTDGVDADRG